MAIVIYFLDTVTQKFRSVGGPDLDPASPYGNQGFGQAPFGLAPFGE